MLCYMQIAKATKCNALHTLKNKISALAEMGNRLATIDKSRKVRGGSEPFRGGLGPHLIQCGLGQG